MADPGIRELRGLDCPPRLWNGDSRSTPPDHRLQPFDEFSVEVEQLKGELEHTIEVPLRTCPGCHAPLNDVSVTVQKRCQVDLPEPMSAGTRFRGVQGQHLGHTSGALGAACKHVGLQLVEFAADLRSNVSALCSTVGHSEIVIWGFRCGMFWFLYALTATWAMAQVKSALNESVFYRNWNDLVCGPRCVKYLIDYYGPPSQVDKIDLMDLIREAQWPEIEAGSSFESLRKTLVAHGIHVKAVRVGKKTIVNWKDPILIHMKNESKLGHFVVWVKRSGSETAEIWTGLGGARVVSNSSLNDERSELMLLTSRVPINNDDVVKSMGKGNKVISFFVDPVVGFVVFWIFVGALFHKRNRALFARSSGGTGLQHVTERRAKN